MSSEKLSENKEESKQQHQSALPAYRQRYTAIHERKMLINSLHASLSALETEIREETENSVAENKSFRPLLEEIQKEITKLSSKLKPKEKPKLTEGEVRAAIIKAIEANDFAKVKELVELGVVKLNTSPGSWSKAPLKVAISSDPKIFKYLLSEGADVTVRGLLQDIALEASWPPTEKDEIFTLLAAKGLAPLPPHFRAAILGDVKALENCSKETLSERDRNGYTLLHYAAANGQRDVIAFLLRRSGMRINEPGPRGETPLLRAASNGQLAAVKYLLLAEKEGENFFQTIKFKVTKEDRAKITEIDVNKDTALHLAASKDQLETVEWLVKEGKADIASCNGQGWTAFVKAAENGKLKTMECLLNHGAKIDEPNGQNLTIIVAAHNKHWDAVKWLVAKGASVNSKLSNYDLLLYAIRTGDLALVTFLVEKGANIHARDDEGRTPFLRAVELDFIEIAEYLLQKNANIKDVLPDGRTALMLPLFGTSVNVMDMMRCLLSHGVDVHARDNRGDTALLIAVRRGRLLTPSILVGEHGANPHDQNNQGETVASLVQNYGNYPDFPKEASIFNSPERLEGLYVNYLIKQQALEMGRPLYQEALLKGIPIPDLVNIVDGYIGIPSTEIEIEQALPDSIRLSTEGPYGHLVGIICEYAGASDANANVVPDAKERESFIKELENSVKTKVAVPGTLFAGGNQGQGAEAVVGQGVEVGSDKAERVTLSKDK